MALSPIKLTTMPNHYNQDSWMSSVMVALPVTLTGFRITKRDYLWCVCEAISREGKVRWEETPHEKQQLPKVAQMERYLTTRQASFLSEKLCLTWLKPSSYDVSVESIPETFQEFLCFCHWLQKPRLMD